MGKIGIVAGTIAGTIGAIVGNRHHDDIQMQTRAEIGSLTAGVKSIIVENNRSHSVLAKGVTATMAQVDAAAKAAATFFDEQRVWNDATTKTIDTLCDQTQTIQDDITTLQQSLQTLEKTVDKSIQNTDHRVADIYRRLNEQDKMIHEQNDMLHKILNAVNGNSNP